MFTSKISFNTVVIAMAVLFLMLCALAAKYAKPLDFINYASPAASVNGEADAGTRVRRNHVGPIGYYQYGVEKHVEK